MYTKSDSNSIIPSIPLAVVGIGCLFPKAADKATFWANIKNKVDAITDVPETHWRLADHYDPDPKRPDHTYGKRGGFLDAVDFNPLEFNIQPNILEAIDTSQLLGLIAAREALRDAGYDPAGEFARERVSVLLGVTGALEMVIPLGARLGYPIWKKALLDAGVPAEVADEVVERIGAEYVPWQENSFPGLLGNVVAGRISKQFNLGGSNSVVDAACGSSLSAVHMAAMELACGHADMVITGGIDTFNDIFMYTCFSKTPALSPTNRICPFDESSDGTLIGEGLGLVTLKRLEDAERDGDHIYAVIKSVGSGSDGKVGAIYEPSVKGQMRTLLNAQKLAGVEPHEIGLIEAHGTGTKVGDATEIKALREVFGESDGRPWCAIGSVKSQIGHAKAAAGAAGLIKTILALHNKILPPTINVDKPQEVITTGNTPFYINTEARPWVTQADKPRRAGVSAFGFGGSNFHCILEEYQHKKRFCDWDGTPQLLAWSAASAAELKTSIKKSLAQLKQQPQAKEIRQLGASTRAAFEPSAAQRLCCCIDNPARAYEILEQACTLVDSGTEHASTPNGIYYSATQPAAATAAKTAVLFPGQGAQYPYMLRDLACHAPEMLEELERADAALSLEQGQQLSNLIYPHSIFTKAEEEVATQNLQATQHAQPAIGSVSLGAWRYLQRYGLEAQAFAGHSYGELTALCAAHSYAPADLYKLSHLRGSLMCGDGSDKGTMLAVSAPLAKIEELIEQEELKLIIANKNTPQQGVLSGSRSEIERAAAACKKRGMRSIPLDVAAAFHSDLVADASVPFRAELEHVEINPPETQVYANKSAALYPTKADAIRTLLAEQIASPVEFVRQIEQMYADGITIFIEVGPGARLSGMVKKILPQDVHIVTLDASNGKRDGMTDVARCLAQLAALGLPLELKRWDENYARTWLKEPLQDDKKPRMSIKIYGSNYVKERDPIPPSTRTLVDAREVKTQGAQPQSKPQPRGSHPSSVPSAAAPHQQKHHSTPATATATGSILNTNTGYTSGSVPASLHMLRSQMSVLQQMQEDTARLHELFLAGQTQALQSMRALMGQPHDAASQPVQTYTAPQHFVPSTPAPVQAQESTALHVTDAAGVAQQSTKSQTQSTPAPQTPAGPDVAAELLTIVAEKTGYPTEMLELDMSLDADLGIDSIKRVEILSAVQEQLPHLPSVEPQQLAALQTLRQIVDTLNSAAAAPQPCSGSAANSATNVDVATELLTIVAEKTGYPTEMLELDMSLDADLGIDSIKRVEILSAVQEQLPHLPSVEPQQLAALQTLRQIVDTLNSAANSATNVDVAAELLTIVAEKTGYPTEMLELDMSLDADLGIDSIKRVEILSAVQEQLPHLPSVEPQQLAALQTLRQIVDTLNSAAAAPQPCSDSAANSATNVDVATELLTIVAEKTGYPTEMLELDMSLDADLGIDSIKRVEILSAVQEQLPHLPSVEPQQLAALQTLRQIVDTLNSAANSANIATNVDVAAELLTIVAEKTGYPTEMLELDMSLDADLGIDSIKRVEILSAVQEQLPHLPSVEPQQLAALQTLRQIVDTLEAEASMSATPAQCGAAQSIDAPAPESTNPQRPSIQRQIIRSRALEQPRAALKIKDPIWVVDDASPLSEEIARALEDNGYSAKIISPMNCDIPQRLGGLLISAPAIGTDSDFLRDAFNLLQRCAPALHTAATDAAAIFFTLSRLDGNFGFTPGSMLQDPLSGGLAGLSKTAAHEWPDIICRALDIDPFMPLKQQVEQVVYELGHTGPVEVGISSNGTTTLMLEDADLPADTAPMNLTNDDVVIISGGGRGVTAEVALQLAQSAQPALLLLGRSPLPETEESWLKGATSEAEIKQALLQNAATKLSPKQIGAQCSAILNQRELRANIARLEAAGSKVIYQALDIRDAEAVHAAVARARQQGTIRGIVHGAGVLADKKIEDKTAEQFDLVYSTKIAGLQALLQATVDDNLDFIALFSSSSGRFGRSGQIDYAVANEVLNKTAQALARQRKECRVLALNWGPWDGGMVNAGLKKLFASEGIGVIDLEAGSRYLVQELTAVGSEVELVISGLNNGAGSNTPEPRPSQTAMPQLPNSVLQIPVSCTHIPALRDHILNARAVVPTALSAEWLALGAMHTYPGMTFFGFDNLRVFRGITLEQDAEQHIELRCGQMQPAEADVGAYKVPMQICDAASGKVYSSAEVILADSLPAGRLSPLVLDVSDSAQEDHHSIYADTRLFHGPAFQGLKQVLGLDSTGIKAMAHNTATPAEWMKSPLRHTWLSAPLLLDCSFQLMILWCNATQQKGSLPSYVRRYRQYVESVPADVMEIRCCINTCTAAMVEADIDFIAPESNQVLARIEGYECTMADNLASAFARNTLE